MAVTSPFFCRTASSLSQPQPTGRSVLFAYSSSHEVGLAGVTGCIRTPSLIPSRWMAGQRRRVLVGDAGSRVVESFGSVAEEMFDPTATRAVRRGAKNDRGCGKVRRRRGRRLLIERRLLLLGRLLCRLLRCFLRCHEHSTPLRFQKW